jgi:AraC-like DNA-binding protein
MVLKHPGEKHDLHHHNTGREHPLQDQKQLQLAHLGFQLIPPAPALRPYIDSFWMMRRWQPLTAVQEAFMHPGGGFGLVFNLGDPLLVDGVAVRDSVFLDGTNTVSRRMGFQGVVESIGIRFHPSGAYPILGIPLSELTNQMYFESLIKDMPLLYAHLKEAVSDAQRIAYLQRWLVERLKQGREQDATVLASLHLLREQRGGIRIKTAADVLFISQRQLQRLYQTHVGMTPKQYAQLLRIEDARAKLKSLLRPTPSSTEIGIALGFTDQSHFIREFKAVVGMTPYQYMLNKRRDASEGASLG